jgi:anti-sigma factor RsiW
MKCSIAMILLSAMIDGEISPREKLLLRQHLAACPRCKEEKEELHTLRAFMSLWPEEEPPRPGRKSPHKKPVA